jgi:uncharacterized membrane protein
MNWKNKKEIRTDLFLVLGMVIVIIGFIDLMKFSSWHVIIAGVIILWIGIYRALKSLGKNKHRFFEFSRRKRR